MKINNNDNLVSKEIITWINMYSRLHLKEPLVCQTLKLRDSPYNQIIGMFVHLENIKFDNPIRNLPVCMIHTRMDCGNSGTWGDAVIVVGFWHFADGGGRSNITELPSLDRSSRPAASKPLAQSVVDQSHWRSPLFDLLLFALILIALGFSQVVLEANWDFRIFRCPPLQMETDHPRSFHVDRES